MLKGLTIILLFQLAGLTLAQLPGIPVPGAILGMVLFFLYLTLTHGGGEPEQKVAKVFLNHLPLFFIPAGVGVITLTAILREQALAILLALVVGTLVAFVATALLMQSLIRRTSRSQDKPGKNEPAPQEKQQ